MRSKLMIALLLPLLLISCKTANEIPPGVDPVRVPSLPTELSQKAERLPDLTDPTMGGLVMSGIEADTAYNDVAFKYNYLIDLYNCVADSINNKKDPDKCLNESIRQ